MGMAFEVERSANHVQMGVSQGVVSLDEGGPISMLTAGQMARRHTDVSGAMRSSRLSTPTPL
jgi:ferric-dicitrate binding protein FerR (iron transport regulator)